MIEKIKALLCSIRFWIIVLGAIIAVLQSINTVGIDLVQILDIIKVTLIAIVGLGTLDSVSVKLGTAINVGKSSK